MYRQNEENQINEPARSCNNLNFDRSLRTLAGVTATDKHKCCTDTKTSAICRAAYVVTSFFFFQRYAALSKSYNLSSNSYMCPFYMEIIILMSWSIWTTRNAKSFNNENQTVQRCKDTFKKELGMVVHRAKSSLAPFLSSWLDNLM